MKRIVRYFLLLMIITLPGVSSANVDVSVDVSGVRFAASVEAEGRQLPLRGAGLLRYMVLIRAYVGALYLPETVAAEAALAPVAKQLVLEYFHPIKGEDFAKATRQKIADNVSAAQLQLMADRIDQLAGLYRDVQPGDRYALTHIPGEGIHLALNGVRLGTVPGDDFARAAFAIWLGENPIDKGFRDQLLGDA